MDTVILVKYISIANASIITVILPDISELREPSKEFLICSLSEKTFNIINAAAKHIPIKINLALSVPNLYDTVKIIELIIIAAENIPAKASIG